MNTSIEAHIQQLLGHALETLGISGISDIEIDSNPSFGDYSSNVAMKLFSTLEKGTWRSPRDFAQAIVDKLDKKLGSSPTFSAISVAGPGFINFTLQDAYLQKFVTDHTQPVIPTVATPESLIVEYMQPNTNKPLHIGHLRNSVLGKALISTLKEIGQSVVATTVNNDRGLHITKSMWAYLMLGTKSESLPDNSTWDITLPIWFQNSSNWKQPTDMEDPVLHKGDFFVGHWYILAEKSVEDTQIQTQWSQMLQAWENPELPHHTEIRKLWQIMNDWFYQGAKETYQTLDVTFDSVSFESKVYQAGKEIIQKATTDGIFERLPDGAVRANLEEKYGLPDKILLRRDGTGIYMTFDVELTRQRNALGADKIFWVVGSDQNLYFQQLFAVCEMLGFGTRENYYHFSYGMVRLPEGKMSSRKGTVVYADDVIKQSIARAWEVMDEAGVGKDLRENEKEVIAKEVGIGAIKYTMLAYDSDSDIAFDVNSSVSFEGNSGPYLQYTGVRCKSIFHRAKETQEPIADSFPMTMELTPNERDLTVSLHRFESVMAVVATTYGLHLLCGYLYELAKAFNAFYATDSVLGDPGRRQFRTHLVRLTLSTLEKGLQILGITIPEKM